MLGDPPQYTAGRARRRAAKAPESMNGFAAGMEC